MVMGAVQRPTLQARRQVSLAAYALLRQCHGMGGARPEAVDCLERELKVLWGCDNRTLHRLARVLETISSGAGRGEEDAGLIKHDGQNGHDGMAPNSLRVIPGRSL